MALNNGFAFNGVRKNYVMTIGKKRTYWAPIRRDFITVPNRPGALLKDTTTDVRTVEVDIEISATSVEELRKNSEDLAEWLLTDDAKELVFDDEPDRVYYAVVDGSFSPSEIVSHGYGTITFICPDPYKYGAEQTNAWPLDDTLQQDFAAKISGSTVENPHVYGRRTNATLGNPTVAGNWFEPAQADYDQIEVLDGVLDTTFINSSGVISQHKFSFDLIAAVERQYGTIPSTDKVQWLKDNFTKITCNWYGSGSNQSGNKANFTIWQASTSLWATTVNHVNSTAEKLSISTTSKNFVDSYGFIHFLAYAEASDGVIASTINTDYVELLIEIKLSYSPAVINDEGSTETPPKFKVTLKNPTTYLDIIGSDDYMRIGRPVNIEEIAVPERELILHDTMSALTGWTDAQSADIDGGVVAGTMVSDGTKFVATSVGTGSQWHGPAKIKSLSQSLTDFHVSFQPILDNDELYKIGRIELYLLDANKKAVGKLAIKDISKGQGGNYAELRVGDTTVNNFLISDYGTNWNTWHNFNGLLELTKKGNMWSAYVCKFIDGDRNNRTSRMFIEWEDKENQFTRSVAYVVVHIGTYGTSVPSRMSIQDLQVFKVNTATTGQIPYIGYPGDVFEFDHATSAIYLNGDYFLRKDFGSRFFNLRPGENSVVFNPSSAIESVKTTWRSRYK